MWGTVPLSAAAFSILTDAGTIRLRPVGTFGQAGLVGWIYQLELD